MKQMRDRRRRYAVLTLIRVTPWNHTKNCTVQTTDSRFVVPSCDARAPDREFAEQSKKPQQNYANEIYRKKSPPKM
jgi:hypothetical protein